MGEAIAAVHPWGVDSASGTEAAPGVKDPARLEAFFRGCRGGRLVAGRSSVSAAVERRFGPYGGRYVPETLIPALDELEREWAAARTDPDFQRRARPPAARLRRPPDARSTGRPG